MKMHCLNHSGPVEETAAGYYRRFVLRRKEVWAWAPDPEAGVDTERPRYADCVPATPSGRAGMPATSRGAGR